jgi:hypothetical protein
MKCPLVANFPHEQATTGRRCSFIHMALHPTSGLGLICMTFLNHTQLDTRYDSSGRVISPSHRPLPTQDNTTYKHKGQTRMPSAGFEPAIPATKRRQTYALDRAANGIGVCVGREIILFMPLVPLMSWNKPVCVSRLVLHSEHFTESQHDKHWNKNGNIQARCIFQTCSLQVTVVFISSVLEPMNKRTSLLGYLLRSW